MDLSLLFLLLSCLTFYECTGIQWASGPEDNNVIYVCANGSLSLPWALVLSSGDVIENIQWFFSGRSDELIATEARSNFFTLPAFSGRVSKTTNAGIDVDHMQDLDAGNYSVEVLVRQSAGDIVTLRRLVYVHITDEVQIADRRLDVNQLPVAKYNNQTDQYHVVLSCGNFTYPTQPPFLATWVTPSGRSLDSDKYVNNQFLLLLPNPVEDGSYICRVSAPAACLHGINSKEGTVTVDKMEARLAVLEARQEGLESRSAQLHSDLRVKDAALETEISTLKSGNGSAQGTVSFHAIVSTFHHELEMYSALVFDDVVTNIGNAYDPTNGRFTAPYNGTYFFIASAEAGAQGRYLWLTLMDGAVEVAGFQTADSVLHQTGSVHAVLNLEAGRSVYVKINNPNNDVFGSPFTAFSGFLID